MSSDTCIDDECTIWLQTYWKKINFYSLFQSKPYYLLRSDGTARKRNEEQR